MVYVVMVSMAHPIDMYLKEQQFLISHDSLKIVTCHLGNGSSICAVKNGKSVDKAWVTHLYQAYQWVLAAEQ